jgi:PAS domain S-box-containing protein
MVALDVRTIIYFAVLLNVLAFLFMLLLWFQNHRKYSGIAFWAVNYFLQMLALTLIYLRSDIPDWISLVFPNALVLTGIVLLLVGLKHFIGTGYPMRYNYLFLAAVVAFNIYAGLIRPDLTLRNYALNACFLLFAGQAVWVLLRCPQPEQRRVTLGPAVVLIIVSLVTLARLIEIPFLPHANDFFQSPSPDRVFYVLQQLMMVFLTFTLMLMLNQRLLLDMGRSNLELSISEEKFARAFRSNPESIAITSIEDGKFLEVNDAFCDATGYPASEVIGRRAPDFDLWVNSSDRERIIAEIQKQGRVTNLEVSYRTRTGRIRTWLLSAEKIDVAGQRCVIWLNMDITDRKIAEDALRRSEENYHTLFTNMSEAFALNEIVLDDKGIPVDYRFLEVNPAFEKMTGLNVRQVVQKSAREVLPALDNSWIGIYGSVALSGQPAYFESYSTPLGKWYQVYAYSPKQHYFVTQFMDITEKKQAEARVIEMETLKQMDKARSELLANVSHELRTPLASIKGFIETLLETDVKWTRKQQLDFLQSADIEADRLTFLIRELLDMSRLDSGRMVLDRKRYSVNEILETCRNVLKSLTARHKLVYELSPGLPDIEVDKTRIGQVITNLVENAVKFSAEGSVITIRVKSENDQIVFEVEDRGEGMSEDVLSNLFNRFYQAERVVSGKTRGTGLGLAISKGIVEAHGGMIGVASQPGKGSVFTFTLPLLFDRKIV